MQRSQLGLGLPGVHAEDTTDNKVGGMDGWQQGMDGMRNKVGGQQASSRMRAQHWDGMDGMLSTGMAWMAIYPMLMPYTPC